MPLTISAGDLGNLAMPDFCERCFWIHRRLKNIPFQIPLPGIFSSIDSYIKNVVRQFFDQNHRVPDWLPIAGQISGYEATMHWKKFSVAHDPTGSVLRGVPDEVFHLDNGHIHIVDYKTARFSATQDALFPKYEVQVNGYAYICKLIELGDVDALTLVYLEPDSDLKKSPQWLERSSDTLMLGFTPKALSVDIKANSFIETLLERAAWINAQSSPPPHREQCETASEIDDFATLVGSI